ncbi:replication/maintenance protein RepL [Borrelia hispanica]|uniref:replication/maintenance protein RepL n=1 Tax=Borrelia hispanica TaxID=40835 RepID=UPI00046661FB|nr:replication/maintenance protein RepL [Borrelia hispanica]
MINKNNNHKKDKYTKNINVGLNIVNVWKIKFEFFVHNTWLIMSALLLLFFNVLHSHKGISNYNVGGHYKLYFTLPFTIVIILVPSSILLYFLYLLRKHSQTSVFVFLEKIAILILLVIGLVTQSVSSWMSFESFFSVIFENNILRIKQSKIEQKQNIFNRLSEKEKMIKDEIADIDIQIKNNKDRIEFAKNKHLNLDYTYKTMKQDYMKEIENAKKENKDLFAQKNEYLKSLDDLRSQFDNLIETTDSYNDKIKAANVLDGTSVVIDRNDYLNIIFVYLLLLSSICLDIFLAMVFCIIQNSYNKFYEQKLLYSTQLPKSIKVNLPNIRKANILKQKVQYNCKISNSDSKKTHKKIDNDKLIAFMKSNLEDDNRTIKSLRKINQDTNLSKYTISKYLSELMNRGLIIKENQRLVLNKD